ncbi:hypothetical protein BDV95DRAFT_154346 [Massariosphaeria phaeospora]|uniref:Uncharacterized protein n=1 Tax=Massariosphaeria phaeospora TaxID=100035 RepID=A0A7C8IM34_9PLEO|nr:hypothetical protein BDV95DRAFT_154346 [Massariosphaeria phaeospora]
MAQHAIVCSANTETWGSNHRLLSQPLSYAVVPSNRHHRRLLASFQRPSRHLLRVRWLVSYHVVSVFPCFEADWIEEVWCSAGGPITCLHDVCACETLHDGASGRYLHHCRFFGSALYRWWALGQYRFSRCDCAEVLAVLGCGDSTCWAD